VHGGGGESLSELVEDFCVPGDETEAGQGVQMQPIVLATDEEEQGRGLPVGSAKMNFLEGATEDDERGFKQVGVGHAGMRQGKTAGHAGAAQGFAGFQAREQGRRVVQASGGFRERHQFVEDGGFGFGQQCGGDKGGFNHLRQQGLVRQNFAGAESGFLVICRESLVRQTEESLGSPLIDSILGEDQPVAALFVGNLIRPGAVRDVVLRQVQILGDLFQAEDLMSHILLFNTCDDVLASGLNREVFLSSDGRVTPHSRSWSAEVIYQLTRNIFPISKNHFSNTSKHETQSPP